MRKKFVLKGLAVSLIISGIMPATSTFAAPLVFKNNEVEEVMITRIIPSEPYMEVTYRKLGIRDDGSPQYLNFQYGEISDWNLYNLGISKYPGNTTIALGRYSNYYHWDEMVDGGTYIIPKTRMSGIDFANNKTNRIDYVISFRNAKQFSRIDYSRCVKSAVYKSGLATECRMEYKDNGLVQYQPYTADGERLELTAVEDAVLTEATESWRAEPGAWPDFWYDTDSGDSSSDSGDSGDSGSSGSSGGSGDDGDGGESSESGGGSEGGENGSGTGGDSGGGGGSSEGGENGGSSEGGAGDEGGGSGSGGNSGEGGSDEGSDGNGGSEDSSSVSADGSSVSSSIASSNVGNGDTNNDANNNGASNGSVGNDIGGNSDNASGIVGFVAGETIDGAENSQDNVDNNSGETNNDADNANSTDVGVPNLGQEEESKPNWSVVFAISMAAAAGLAGWWFLFFGKYHLKRRKENKK